MKTLILAAAAVGMAVCATPTLAQAPNDAAATLRQGKAYSNATLTPARDVGSHSRVSHSRHHSASASRAGAPDADHSADQLNAKQLGGTGGS